MVVRRMTPSLFSKSYWRVPDRNRRRSGGLRVVRNRGERIGDRVSKGEGGGELFLLKGELSLRSSSVHINRKSRK